MDGSSIHALREEGDRYFCRTALRAELVRSTPSARRATWRGRYNCIGSTISIHALREEGDMTDDGYIDEDDFISIHALREEGDSPVQPRLMVGKMNFR